MDIKEFLNTVCEQIKYKPVKQDIVEELQSHIKDTEAELIESGIEKSKAEEKAIEQMGSAEEIGKRLNKIHKPKLDWKLLILLIILVGYGILVSMLKNNNIGRTIVYMIFGIIVGIVIYFYDYRKLKNYSNVIYIIATILMVWPYTILGITNILGLEKFTPATITLPLYLIAFIGLMINYNKNNVIKFQINDEVTLKINKDFIKILVLAIISLVLMAYIHSIINMAILGFTYILITVIKIIQSKDKTSIKRMIYVLGGGVLIATLLFITSINTYTYEKISVSFNPESDPYGTGYTGMLQKEILENAKLIGKADTDIVTNGEIIINSEDCYIFIYLVGQIGILPTLGIVLAIILISVKLILNAKNIKDSYGKLLVIALGTVYIIQSFASVLMNVNLGVQVDVSIPFVSNSAVSFIINCISAGLILSVYRRKDLNFAAI